MTTRLLVAQPGRPLEHTHFDDLPAHLQPGDLLVMGGRFQADWRHGVPKVARPVGPRISVTWRWSSGKGRADRGVSFRAPRRFDSSGHRLSSR